ncbi:L,D-transpeptidase [Nocardioides sp. GXZ039]|uniref:L,D-transpeptidase n=1 Tax=Nocardioides sp. GXZ039 TaxID=3136018 RepID=UPI0030F464B1
MAILGVSVATSAIALLGGMGVLPSSADGDPEPGPDDKSAVTVAEAVGEPASGRRDPSTSGPTSNPAAEPTTLPTTEPSSSATTGSDEGDSQGPTVDETATVLPEDSGEGKRVVFSEARQRVWLVGSDGAIRRTYLVSGSLTDNLHPGTYEVYSRSEDAIGIDDSGTMKWFVRFTQGDTGAAIGFHTIPVDDGERVQTVGDLGTPQSHGCIRQATPDALALWDFAPLGTKVVVTV